MSCEKATAFGEFRRAGASLACALLVAGMAVLFYASGAAPFKWLSILPAFIALLLVYNTIHSLLAAGTPPSKLTFGIEPLCPGQSTTIVIRQAGPARFDSLRANLVCERITRTFPNKTRTITYPCQLNFFDSGPCEIPYAETREFATEVTIPDEAEPSRESAELVIRWRIELWGKIRRRADFMRPFDFEVI